MRFATLNSIYEIDPAWRRLRRVSSNGPLTSQGAPDPHAAWRSYLRASPIRQGTPVIIVWRVEECDGGLVLRTTVTSPVVAVLN